MQCKLFPQCKEALEKLNINLYSNVFSSQGDKCYGPCCYSDSTYYYRGNELYEMPIFGVRFGMTVKKEKKYLFNEGVNAYHGTHHTNIDSIIKNGFKKVGDKLENGVLDFVKGHIIENERHKYYTSSSLVYSLDYCQHKENNCSVHKRVKCPDDCLNNPRVFYYKGKRYYFVFQFRHKKGSYKIESQTLRVEVHDRKINSNVLEYVSDNDTNFVIIGLIVYQIPEWANYEKPNPFLLKNPEFKAFARVYKQIYHLEKNLFCIEFFEIEFPLFLEEFSKLFQYLDDVLNGIDKIENAISEIEILDDKLDDQVKGTDAARGTTCVTGIVGSALLFAGPAAIPFGIGFLAFSGVGRAATDITDASVESSRRDDFSKLCNEITDLKISDKLQYCEEAKIKFDEIYKKSLEKFKQIKYIDSDFDGANIAFSIIMPVQKAFSGSTRIVYNGIKNGKIASNAVRQATVKGLGKVIGVVGIAIDSVDLIYRLAKNNETELRKTLRTTKNELNENVESLKVVMDQYDEFKSILRFYERIIKK